MPGIYDTRMSIEEIVVDEHLIPSSDKVDIDVIGNLKVSIHAKETGERTINGIMESDAI